ncbi:unnamed protein product [Leptosia nina]|uniref:Peptidase S1 domain-containing protein n=1 Tax=Leptosia nina TaxID=320188 RepID=A0AAV1K1X0_9NEOP
MKSFLVILAIVAGAVAYPMSYEPIQLDYHEKVGIPMVDYLRSAEGATDFDGARIVGGQPVQIDSHPHIAGLLIALTNGLTSMCGSSILSNTKVVTAAHCWRTQSVQGRSVTVVLGSSRLTSGGTRVTTANVQMHSGYNTDLFNNDIAIITMPHVGFNNNIRAISLPSGLLLSMNFEGILATAVGYGRLQDGGQNSNDALHRVTLTVIENWMCTNIYGPERIISSTLCTSGQGRVGPCQGDSGGPLELSFQGTRYLIGVTSFVAARGCQAGLPAGFARVTSFASWIRARL